MSHQPLLVSGDDRVLRQLCDAALEMSPWLSANSSGFQFHPAAWPHAASRNVLSTLLGEKRISWNFLSAPTLWMGNQLLPAQTLSQDVRDEFPLQPLTRQLFQTEKIFKTLREEMNRRLNSLPPSANGKEHLPTAQQAQGTLRWLETTLGQSLSGGLEAQPSLDFLLGNVMTIFSRSSREHSHVTTQATTPTPLLRIRHWGIGLIQELQAQENEPHLVREILQRSPWDRITQSLCTLASQNLQTKGGATQPPLLGQSPLPTHLRMLVWPRGLATTFREFETRITEVRGLLIHGLNRWEMARELETLTHPFLHPSIRATTRAFGQRQQAEGVLGAQALFDFLRSTPLLMLFATGVLQCGGDASHQRVCLGAEIFRHIFARSFFGEPLFGSLSITRDPLAKPTPVASETADGLSSEDDVFRFKETLSIAEAQRLWSL